MTRRAFLATLRDRIEQDFTGRLDAPISYEEMELALSVAEEVISAAIVRMAFEGEPQSAAAARGDA